MLHDLARGFNRALYGAPSVVIRYGPPRQGLEQNRFLAKTKQESCADTPHTFLTPNLVDLELAAMVHEKIYTDELILKLARIPFIHRRP